MNTYQKAATLALRLCACALIVIAAMGFAALVYDFWAEAGLGFPQKQRAASSAVFLVTGGIIGSLAKSLGSWMGSDLGE